MPSKVEVLSRVVLASEHGAVTTLRRGREAALLTLLAISYPHSMGILQIKEAMGWQEDDTDNRVHQVVSRLRALIRESFALRSDHDPVQWSSAGYTLNLGDAMSVDHRTLFDLVDKATQALSFARTPQQFDAIWNDAGDALTLAPKNESTILPGLVGFPCHSGYEEKVRSKSVEARRVRCDAGLKLGRHLTVMPELESLFGMMPTDVLITHALTVATYRVSGEAQALEVIRKHRRALADIGLRPQSMIDELDTFIRRGDASLTQVVGDATAPSVVQPPARDADEDNHAPAARSATPRLRLAITPALLERAPYEDDTGDLEGSLAGDWLQVTYPPRDLRMDGRPWSIEWLSISQNDGHTLHGEMWRLWPSDQSQRWEFLGVYVHPDIKGTYLATRGHPRLGEMTLKRTSNSLLFGYYLEDRNRREGLELTFSADGAPMMLVRAQFAFQLTVSAVSYLREVPVPVLKKYLPAEILDKLARLPSLAYGSAAFDNYQALAAERARRGDLSGDAPPGPRPA